MKNKLEDVRKIFAEDKAEIIEKYGGTGAGIGARNDHYTIIVYRDQPTDTSITEVEIWKDVPVAVHYTGQMRAV